MFSPTTFRKADLLPLLIFLFGLFFYHGMQGQISFQYKYSPFAGFKSFGFAIGPEGNSIYGRIRTPGPNTNIILTEVDSLENPIWEGVFGRNSPGINEAKDIIVTMDSGIVMVGTNDLPPGNAHKMQITKIDKNRNLVWSKSLFAGNANIVSDGYAVLESPTGDLSVVGNVQNRMCLITFDGAGNFLGAQEFGSQFYSVGFDMVRTDDGGLLLSGFTNGFFGGDHYILVKLNALGTHQWTKAIYFNFHAYLQSLTRVSPDHYIFSCVFPGSPSNDIYMAVINGNGNILHQKVFSAPFEQAPFFSCPASGGKALITGQSRTSNSNHGLLVMEVDSTLNLIFANTYTSPDSIVYGNAAGQHSNGDFSIIGTSSPTYPYRMRVDSLGNAANCFSKINLNFTVSNVNIPNNFEFDSSVPILVVTDVTNQFFINSGLPVTPECPPTVLASAPQLFAQATPSGVQTQWQMPEFSDVARIDLIRQSDNGDRQLAAQLFQPGRSDLSAFDPVPGTGRVSYQLEILMLDGERRFSNVVSLQLEGGERLRLWPNPFEQDRAQPLVLEGLPSGPTRVELLDLSGKVLWREAVPSGMESLGLGLPKLSLGMYFVRVGSPSGSRVLKLLLD